MKRFGRKFLCCLLAVCVLSSSLIASAAVKASAYLSSYSADLTARSGGKILVGVDVGATGYMTKIGATEIYIYESSDNVIFGNVTKYTSDDYPEMLGSGTYYYDTPITHQGTPGKYYKASVYVYAENSSGSDDGHYMTVSCRAIT